ncbi:MAG: hypothetical protein WC359_12315 [Dehalococcoidia bacterium]|jgi:hypothetical protein
MRTAGILALLAAIGTGAYFLFKSNGFSSSPKYKAGDVLRCTGPGDLNGFYIYIGGISGGNYLVNEYNMGDPLQPVPFAYFDNVPNAEIYTVEVV